ncbi:enoyl-CoA hydratase/isomerase family protein, partial [Desulfosarcina sp. OttesenSCG-928-B08]|nr:enoyl-CoA hydratase/isomerase family protein [Desulfosarcina sp. OttesenSCG-928-B08]
ADLLEPDAFEDGIAALVKEICQSSPLIIRLNKRAVNRHLEMSPAAAMKSVNDMFLNELMKTEDTQEGLNSFAEKRRAVWVNR